jgi:hypothetical protein
MPTITPILALFGIGGNELLLILLITLLFLLGSDLPIGPTHSKDDAHSKSERSTWRRLPFLFPCIFP